MELMIFWDCECGGRLGSRHPRRVSRETLATAETGKSGRVESGVKLTFQSPFVDFHEEVVRELVVRVEHCFHSGKKYKFKKKYDLDSFDT